MNWIRVGTTALMLKLPDLGIEANVHVVKETTPVDLKLWEWKVLYDRKGTGTVRLKGRTAHPRHAVRTVEATISILLVDLQERQRQMDEAKNLMDSIDSIPCWGE